MKILVVGEAGTGKSVIVDFLKSNGMEAEFKETQFLSSIEELNSYNYALFLNNYDSKTVEITKAFGMDVSKLDNFEFFVFSTHLKGFHTHYQDGASEDKYWFDFKEQKIKKNKEEVNITYSFLPPRIF